MASHSTRWRVQDEVGRDQIDGDQIGADTSADRQMAADIALLDEVARGGSPILRIYTWARPALSLGRFQPDTDIDTDACDRHGVAVVRRPTGGRALLHGGDVTYAAVLPRPAGAAGSVDAVYMAIADALIAGLRLLGVDAEVARNDGETAAACFSSLRGSDLRVGGRKLVGSAQVNRGGAVLQHGSVLLARLHLDETDLVRFPTPEAREAERAHLLASTTTLEELAVGAGPTEVASALTSGFAECFDLDLTSSVR